MLYLSDHRLVQCGLDLPLPKVASKILTYRCLSTISVDDLLQDAANVNWNDVNSFGDVNEQLNWLNDAIIQLYNKHAPLKIIVLKKNYKPYITHTIKAMIRLKRKAYRRYCRSNNSVHLEYYKDLRNYVSFAIKSEKKAFIQYKTRLYRNSPAKLW
ncbi:unnamed protein product [Acanthoscelides obtectus]|uniref:Uncharacterized protein n=1 Tax=Acanthoscelides obtectus TaxID=200917 RepID=A0A9P0L1J9_ACAOB|nr:unnamed protein product [Acanthoscelides obtectus]CAK1639334.1 hypothetical protein AOBTE_LOCUS11129 [Acanthoscelides obtectus]